MLFKIVYIGKKMHFNDEKNVIYLRTENYSFTDDFIFE